MLPELPVPGPEVALALFLLLAIYAGALHAANSGRFPGLAWLGGRTIGRDLAIGLGVLATAPAIALAVVLASHSAGQREDRAAELLQETANTISTGLDELFDKHMNGIASLANTIQRSGRMDVASLTDAIVSHHELYPDYLTMLAANTFGDIVTATTMVQGRPLRISSLNHNISDRPYFVTPMREGGVFVSDVFQGRGLGQDPIIAVSARVSTIDGTPWGIVEGSLNLQRLSRFHPATTMFGQDIELLILDQRDRVISSTRADSRILETVSLPLLNADAEKNDRLYTHAVSGLGWQVHASIPRAPVHAEVWVDARATLLWLLSAVAIAIMLSTAIARRVTRPLTALKTAVRALDLEGADADLAAPPGAPEEIRQVYEHLSSMSNRMQNSHRQLTAAVEAGKHYRQQLETTLARRETEIRSRTNELEHTNRNLRTLSNVDQLTGLANRRRFTEAIDQAWRHCMREQSPVSLVLLDIDHFKAFNDTYGHQNGDYCLARVGGALSACVWRPLDLVARYGGEEFVMVLANTELDNALSIAGRTRRVIEDMRLPHAGAPDGFVTLSLGVASTVPQRGSDYQLLLQEADRALYFAKEKGRNRVGWADQGELRLMGDKNPGHNADQIIEFRLPVTDTD
ncbi:MAG: diguanylate cyclase [Gammaproteobacteria bacterium]|nr:diguanylate cyclase [Gammaproteobacteria bacterium]